MKLTTRARYGVRMLLDIAAHHAPVTLVMVAQRQAISIQYLRQLALLLSRNGILVSAKGKNGGYQLARSPNSITMYDVLSALEGDICITPEKETDENPYELCLRVYLYQVADKSLSEMLSHTTLADLLVRGEVFFQG
jgi:Rrf2 family protein